MTNNASTGSIVVTDRLTDPLARVNQPLRSRHCNHNSGSAARQRIQRHQQQRSNSLSDTEDNNSVIFASNAHEKLPDTRSTASMRELVGDFGMTLFNPLACLPQCTAATTTPRSTKIVWDMEEGEFRTGTISRTRSNKPALPAKSPCSESCANLTLESLASTAATTLESDDSIPLEIEVEPASQLEDCPRILTPTMMQQLHEDGLPDSLQMCRWERCFAIGRDGDSFCSLMERTLPYQRSIVVIQTLEGHVLGGFAAMPWNKRDQFSNAYYGTGQSFLFASHPAAMCETAKTEPEKPLHLFRWTGTNDFCQICDPETQRFGMGGGADFGFLVQDNFWRGRTGPCGTFGNPSLTPSEYFEIEALEVYGLRPFGESVSGSPCSISSSIASSPSLRTLL